MRNWLTRRDFLKLCGSSVALMLAACGVAPAATPAPTNTTFPSATPTLTGTPAPTNTPTATPTPTATANPGEKALEELKRMKKVDGLTWISANIRDPSVFPPHPGVTREFKNGSFITTVTGGKTETLEYVLPIAKSVAITTKFEYDSPVNNIQMFITNVVKKSGPRDGVVIWSTGGDQNEIAVVNRSDVLRIIFNRNGLGKDQDAWLGMDLPNRVTFNPRLLFRLEAHSRLFMLFDLSSGRILCDADFGTLTGREGTTIFRNDGSFYQAIDQNGVQLDRASFCLNTEPGHRTVLKELSVYTSG